MIDSKALPNGGIRIEINGNGEDMPAHIASAFIAKMLFQMYQQAKQTKDEIDEGGAIIFPHATAVEKDTETGEPRLRLAFGKALLVVSMPPGQIKNVAKIIMAT